VFHSPSQRTIPVSTGYLASDTPLFEALICETHHAGLMTAVVASFVHGAVRDGVTLEPAVIDRFMPVEPAILLSLTRCSLLDIEPLSDTQDIVEAFFDEVRLARAALSLYFADEAGLGQNRAMMLHAQRLTRHWRSACHEALRAVRQLELEVPGRFADVYCAHAQALSQILLRAERGEAPCLDETGALQLPDLPQRRRALRRSLGQPARLFYRQLSAMVMAKDVSEGGLGLLRVPALSIDEIVGVELMTGRRFASRVVWSRDDAAGLQFLTPLSPADPLLSL
jgi:PilZ domain